MWCHRFFTVRLKTVDPLKIIRLKIKKKRNFFQTYLVWKKTAVKLFVLFMLLAPCQHFKKQMTQEIELPFVELRNQVIHEMIMESLVVCSFLDHSGYWEFLSKFLFHLWVFQVTKLLLINKMISFWSMKLASTYKDISQKNNV